MSKIYRLVILFILPYFGVAQATSNSFDIYDTPYEQEILMNSNSSNLELLLALGPNSSAERTEKFKTIYEAFVAKIKSSKLMKLPEEKLVNGLHDQIRKEFLFKYQRISPFHEIAESGTYNCVSSAALLALVLDDLAIPYVIQEMPEHVNIIAYPATKAVLIEMTAVNNVKVAPSQKYISMVTTSLVDMGIVSEQALKTQGQNNVYQQYINKAKTISLRQLAGVQYFNEAHEAFDEELQKVALKNALKMEILYPGELANISKFCALNNILNDSEYTTIEDVFFMGHYANLPNSSAKNLSASYSGFIYEALYKKENRKLADSSLVLLEKMIKDSLKLNPLKSIYYLGMVDYFDKVDMIKKKFNYASLAYACDPSNRQAENAFLHSFFETESEKHEDLLEDEEYYNDERNYQYLLKKLDSLTIVYPQMLTNDYFKVNYFNLSTLTSNYFYIKNIGNEANDYFDKALASYHSIEDKEIVDEDYLGWLYAEQGTFLYRKKDYKGALKALDEGLKLSPDHKRLIERRKIVLKYINE